MLAILRADDSMAIASKESLQSDLNSLERMVTDFMRDNNIAVDSAQVHQAVSQGDLTVMMSQYEKEIKTPYKSIISGQLIRSILIQIQKTKVDGAMAISGIDKLLKSQQLLLACYSCCRCFSYSTRQIRRSARIQLCPAKTLALSASRA
ncbi:hypothetical protein CJJ09_005356 [Candidozyma auris]|nr:hypothetical protein CJJ09_005356 [[Candida] auris]